MLYAIVCRDDYGDVAVCAIRKTHEAAKQYAAYLNAADEDYHWAVPIVDDDGIGDDLEKGCLEEPE